MVTNAKQTTKLAVKSVPEPDTDTDSELESPPPKRSVVKKPVPEPKQSVAKNPVPNSAPEPKRSAAKKPVRKSVPEPEPKSDTEMESPPPKRTANKKPVPKSVPEPDTNTDLESPQPKRTNKKIVPKSAPEPESDTATDTESVSELDSPPPKRKHDDTFMRHNYIVINNNYLSRLFTNAKLMTKLRELADTHEFMAVAGYDFKNKKSYIVDKAHDKESTKIIKFVQNLIDNHKYRSGAILIVSENTIQGVVNAFGEELVCKFCYSFGVDDCNKFRIDDQCVIMLLEWGAESG